MSMNPPKQLINYWVDGLTATAYWDDGSSTSGLSSSTHMQALKDKWDAIQSSMVEEGNALFSRIAQNNASSNTIPWAVEDGSDRSNGGRHP